MLGFQLKWFNLAVCYWTSGFYVLFFLFFSKAVLWRLSFDEPALNWSKKMIKRVTILSGCVVCFALVRLLGSSSCFSRMEDAIREIDQFEALEMSPEEIAQRRTVRCCEMGSVEATKAYFLESRDYLIESHSRLLRWFVCFVASFFLTIVLMCLDTYLKKKPALV